MPNKTPYYPNKKVSYGNVYFFIKNKEFSINPFDKASIAEAKEAILLKAKEVSPSYKAFIKAATLATGLSARTINTLTTKDK